MGSTAGATRPAWEIEKAWSDRFVPEIKRIIGGTLVATATIEDDQKLATDLIVMSTGNVRIACRVRRFQYLQKFADEFTIRCRTSGHAATEINKVLAGWGDLLFYGFSDITETVLERWTIARLTVFREVQHLIRAEFQENADGSAFFAYDWSAFPPEFILASSWQRQLGLFS